MQFLVRITEPSNASGLHALAGLECIVPPEVAEKIVTRLTEVSFTNYAVIAFLETVEVVRGDKYT